MAAKSLPEGSLRGSYASSSSRARGVRRVLEKFTLCKPDEMTLPLHARKHDFLGHEEAATSVEAVHACRAVLKLWVTSQVVTYGRQNDDLIIQLRRLQRLKRRGEVAVGVSLHADQRVGVEVHVYF